MFDATVTSLSTGSRNTCYSIFLTGFFCLRVVLIVSLVLECNAVVLAGLTDCTDFTTSQWSCALPLMSHQSYSAFFFAFCPGAKPFCFGSNPDPGPFLCSAWGWTLAHRAEEAESLSRDVATTMARSVKIAADRRNIRSMADVKIPARSDASSHSQTSSNPLPTSTITSSFYGAFHKLHTADAVWRHWLQPRPQPWVQSADTSGVPRRAATCTVRL